ncbi:MAG: CocE/NonD family hydrolase [Acidimicrobiales bacterium]
MTAPSRTEEAAGEIVCLRDVPIPLSDGTVLAARLFLPAGAEDAPVPAILDFLPYRQGDLMAIRDWQIYTWFAARGYGCARVDLRGTGNSTGIITDEYSEQELEDGEEVIAWLAGQPWCDGAVGMTGISWGGFNSLQLAARRPEALKAIITLCASDDRYSDDVHYRGGCVLAVDMLQWAVSMLTWNALPPDPRVAGESWRVQWRERVEQTPAFIEPWMSHQLRDAYWAHGSVCEDYSAIQIPVFAVGGWSDGYVDAVLRLLSGLSGPRKGLIGPWSHAYPNHSTPGPEIGYFNEALRFWDRWLKGIDNGVDTEPMLCAYIQDYTAPASHHESWPGRFVTEATWPPSHFGQGPKRLVLDCGPSDSPSEGRLCPPESLPGETGGPGGASGAGGAMAVLWHKAEQTAGLDAGSLTADGGYGDWPGDQRGEDGRSLAFTSAALEEPLEILGNASAVLELSSDRARANVIVRLCDIAPGGESLLVTRGMLNLTHRFGHDRAVDIEPGQMMRVAVPLKAIGHRFAPGHRIRLSVSTTYWPWIWPASEEVTLGLTCGGHSYLELPARSPAASTAGSPAASTPASAGSPAASTREDVSFLPPEDVEVLSHEVLASRPTSRRIVSDLITSSATVELDWDVGGRVRIDESGLEYDGSNLTRYRIASGDPLSADVETEQFASLRRAGEFDVRIETSGQMTSDSERFLVTLSLDAKEAGTRVLARRWSLAFPREGL